MLFPRMLFKVTVLRSRVDMIRFGGYLCSNICQYASRRCLTSISKGKGSRLNILTGNNFKTNSNVRNIHMAEGNKNTGYTGGTGYEGKWFWKMVIGSSLIVGPAAVCLKVYLDNNKFAVQSSSVKKPVDKVVKEKPVKKPITFDLPVEITYLIIGAGTAAYAACRAIRSKDLDAKILMVGDEMYLPYMRPPLSKELWFSSEDAEKVNNLTFKTYNGSERTIFFEKDEFFCAPKDLESKEHGGIAIALGLKAEKIDVEKQMVHFTNGQSIAYKKCLIATGGTPKNLSVFQDVDKEVSERLTLFRNIDDFKKLTKVMKNVKDIVIIGGGFMGSELACALGNKATDLKTFKVTQIFPESGNMGQVLPEFLSKWATEKVQEEGAKVLADKQVTKVRFDKKNKTVILGLDDGSEVSADHVIVSVGLDPNIELAKESGLEVDPKLGGFLVNAELEARSNLWVAGDAACFYDTKLGRRRVEHHDHAVVSGRLAGENMTGACQPYFHQSMLWSDLGAGIGYEAIGLVDSTLPTVSVFAKADPNLPTSSGDEQVAQQVEASTEKHQIIEVSNREKSNLKEEFGKGVVFYLKDDAVVGVLLWNIFNKMPVARQIVKEPTKFDDYAEVAKLFNLFGEPKEKPSTESTDVSPNEVPS